jgi:Calcium-activated chloride channel
VLLFSAPFPIAPFLSFLNNLVELRANLYKRAVFYKRNFAQGANSIGSWSDITSLIVYTGIITNGLMIAFTNNGPTIILETYYPGAVEGYKDQQLFYKLVIVLVYEHFIFVLSYIIEISIPDVPAAVRTGRIAEQFIRAEREITEVAVGEEEKEFDELFYQEGNDPNYPAASPDEVILI